MGEGSLDLYPSWGVGQDGCLKGRKPSRFLLVEQHYGDLSDSVNRLAAVLPLAVLDVKFKSSDVAQSTLNGMDPRAEEADRLAFSLKLGNGESLKLMKKSPMFVSRLL